MVIPLIPNSAPVNEINDIVRSEEPRFDSVRLALPFVPVETVPKLSEVGLTDNFGCVPLTAVAERLTATGELPPSPDTVSVPLKLAAAVGVTFTDKLLDCPAASAKGRLAPDTLNCELETVACVMFNATVPTFDTVIVCVACFPTPTLPKLTVAGLTWKRAVAVCVADLVTTPAQPFIKKDRTATEVTMHRSLL